MARWWLATLCLSGALVWTDVAGLRWPGLAGSCLAVVYAIIKVRSILRRRAARRTIDELRRMRPDDFEREVGRWLWRDGWQVEHRGGTGDGGIDILARRRGETLAIQCKRYAESAAVSASQVRDLYGAAIATGASSAVLVTTGRVSTPALRWAETLPPGPGFRLHDLHCLAALARGSGRV